MYDEYAEREPSHRLEVPVNVTVEWDNDEVQKGAVRNVTAAILQEHKDAISKKVFQGLGDLVNGLLMEVIEEEVTLTDRWGKPVSEPTSVKTLLQQSAEEWLTEKVDSYGHADGYSNKSTRAQYLFKKAIGESLTDRVKKIIQKEIGSLDDLIAAEVKAQLRRKIK